MTARDAGDQFEDKSAYSDDMVYRWWFERRWSNGPTLCFVGLNPGTGDTDNGPRPTLRKVVAWAKREGCGAVVVVNLFAYRSTDPRALRSAVDAVGARNDDVIREQSARAKVTLVAWGADRFAKERARRVLTMLTDPVCAGTTKSGAPLHPLLVPTAKPLVSYPSTHSTAPEHQVDEAQTPLPIEIFEGALVSHELVQRQRIMTMYNRARAVFAEFIVAELLPSARVNVDPAAAWDVTWQPENQRIRIEVKCAGEFLPRKGDGYRAKPVWKFAVPKSGLDPDTKSKISSVDYNFDILLLARHRGKEIAAGWSFYVLTCDDALALHESADLRDLADHQEVRPEGLAAAILERQLPSRVC